MATKPEYKGFFHSANQPTTDEWIEVFVSDWNKDHFAFYAYIDLLTFREDIENIWKLVHDFNYGGDIYIELIDYSTKSERIKRFYDYLYEKGYYSDWAALDPKVWEKYWIKKEVKE